MELLLLGGAGYVGSHTAVELLSAGSQVVIADSFEGGYPDVISRIQTITGKPVRVYQVDGRDRDGMETVFRENHFEAVLHFAALKAVGESVREPLRYYRNNLDVTLTLLETMERHGVYRLVFSSSAAVYGAREQMPLTEDAALSPSNPYGWSKLMAEQMLRDVCAASECWAVCALRYFNPVGAHESGLMGEEPGGVPGNLMPCLTQAASGKREMLQIFGGDYPTRDGTGVRDYIHVMDLAKGHAAALSYLMGHAGYNAFNLGTGRPLSVLELISAFEEATGRPISRVMDSRRPGDVAVCWADTEKARRELGWQAERSVEDMCRDAWRWQRELDREARGRENQES